MVSDKLSPNFFIIGAPKAATTSLSSLLEQHPEAGISRVKEPHFFSLDRNYKLGWEKYLAFFSHCAGKKAIGDASTSYCRIRYNPMTVKRIQTHIANPRIIYMVRHPIERMASAYVEHMGPQSGNSFTSINDAVRRQPMIIDSSRYWEVFDVFRSAFGTERVKVVWFEDYTADTISTFREVCRFLGIDDAVVPDLGKERRNSREIKLARLGARPEASAPIDMTWNPETRQWVIAQIRDDNLRFLEHFGRPSNYWGNLY